MTRIAEWMEKVAHLCQKAEQDGLSDSEFIGLAEIAKLHQEVKALALSFPLPTSK